MKALWEKYSDLYNARILRERIIIALCVLAFVYFMWDFLVVNNIRKERAELDNRYQAAGTQIKKLSAEEKFISQALLKNPNAKKQREILRLEDKITELDKDIEKLSVGLISAEKLPDVIREVLVHQGNLSLQGLVALEPEKLRLVQSIVEDEESEEQRTDVGVFKHRVVFQVSGQYFSIRDYLKKLESSEWSFYWSDLDYVVDQYPKAIAQIEVYTLSTDTGFIGE